MDEIEYELFKKATREDKEDKELGFFEEETEKYFEEIKDLIRIIKSYANDYDTKDGLLEIMEDNIKEMF